jgi:uncharacterized delta-60 repeat protein
MRRIIGITAFLAVAAVACNINSTSTLNNPAATPSKPQAAKVLGMLEVEISSQDGALSSVKFVDANPKKGLQAQGIAVPYKSSDWTFTPGLTEYLDNDFSNIDPRASRYFQNTIGFTNNSNTHFNHLYMYAVSLPTDLAGTPFVSIKTLSGVVLGRIDAEAVARAIRPNHAMQHSFLPKYDLDPTDPFSPYFDPSRFSDPSGLEVYPSRADLVYYTAAQTADVRSKLMQAPFSYTDPTVLEYGFTGQNIEGRRDIPKRSECTPGIACNKGTITWAFNFPRSLPTIPTANSSNLGKFSFRFVIVADDINILTQSAEELAAGTLAGRKVTTFDQDINTSIHALRGTTLRLGNVTVLDKVTLSKAVGSNIAAAIKPTVQRRVASGTLDNYFGSNGTRVEACNLSLGRKIRVAVQNDGKILTVSNVGPVIILSRFTADGYYDSGGTVAMGSAYIDMYNATGGRLVNLNINAIAVQTDGKVLIAGDAQDNGGSNGFVVIRLNPDLARDSSFRSDIAPGISFAGIGFYGGIDHKNLRGQAMATKTVGGINSIVVAGYAKGDGAQNYNEDFAVAKIKDNGNLETSFNPTGSVPGIQITDVSGPDNAYAVGIQPDDNKIVLGGISNNHQTLVRYKTDGSLDSSFGTGGIVTNTLPNNLEARGSQINTLKMVGNSILVGGQTHGPIVYQPFNYFIAKYSAGANAGSLDTSFAGTGYVTGDFSTDLSDHIINDLVISNGSIIAAGVSANSNGTNTSLVKYSSSGVLETSFGTGGRVVLDLYGQGKNDSADSIALLQNGKIVVAGAALPFDPFSLNCESLASFNP